MKPNAQDYRTADAMIKYYKNYDKFGNREHQQAAAKRFARKNKSG